MSLYFDKNYNVTHIDFHCYVQRQHQWELDSHDILRHLLESDFSCKK